MPNEQMRKFFKNLKQQGLMVTYDDVRLHTGYSETDATSGDLSSQLSRNIGLRIPIISSPMDKVTEADMAIAMALAGGVGVIHNGLSPEAQAKAVDRVKNRLNERVDNPVPVRDNDKVEQVHSMREERGYLFHTFPVIDASKKAVGIVSRNDFDFCIDNSRPVSEIMTPFSELITAPPQITAREAYKMMLKHKKKVLPLIDEDEKIAGLYIFSELKRIFTETHEHNVDQSGQLVVGAAVGVLETAEERAELLARKKCNFFQVNTAHGNSKNVIETVKMLKRQYPNIDVVAGNVSRGDGALRLVEAGADGILVGQGPGSICTTRIVAGVGAPQVSAIYDCVEALKKKSVPVCADGGITSSGDIAVALAIGASSVMLGSLLAGTEESPGDIILLDGVRVKSYRGMGSLGAMRDNATSRDRYGQSTRSVQKVVPEGVEGVVPYRGTVQEILNYSTGGIRSSMGYLGVRTLAEFRDRAEIFRLTPASVRESHPHDITITAQSPNYQGRS